MDIILQDLQASIEKNLPAQVGEVLKKRLEQAEIDADRVKKLEKDLEFHKSEINALKSQVAHRYELERREKDVKTKLEEIELRERDLKVFCLETQLAEANKRADVVTDLARTVFKNPTLKTFGWRNNSETVPVPNSYGGTNYETRSQNVSLDKTEEIE